LKQAISLLVKRLSGKWLVLIEPEQRFFSKHFFKTKKLYIFATPKTIREYT